MSIAGMYRLGNAPYEGERHFRLFLRHNHSDSEGAGGGRSGMEILLVLLTVSRHHVMTNVFFSSPTHDSRARCTWYHGPTCYVFSLSRNRRGGLKFESS